jgi:type VI secretion system protein ImpE
MTPEELIKAGELQQALSAAKQNVQANPADPKHRVYLFQLQCVLGQWKESLAQLSILNDMDADSSMFANVFSPVVESEILRSEIFKGSKTPIIFGEPEDWMGVLVHANQMAAQGEIAAYDEAQKRAFDKAPATKGKIDGTAFEWIADADTRLGPMLEVILQGCYRWVPFMRIASIKFEPTKNLCDLVWRSANFTWTNGGAASGFVPVRYFTSENCPDSAIQLARKTEWIKKSEQLFIGIGQRVLTNDQADTSILEIKEITLEVAPGSAVSENG